VIPMVSQDPKVIVAMHDLFRNAPGLSQKAAHGRCSCTSLSKSRRSPKR